MVSLKPGHASAQNLLGVALGRLGRGQEALAAFDAAEAIDPRAELPLINKGERSIRSGAMPRR